MGKEQEELSQEIIDEIEKDTVFKKDINQLDKVEPVSKALISMGTFWKKITTKLSDDEICYMCKKELKQKEKFDIVEVPHNKIDKGLIAFASICQECNKK